MSLHDSEPNPLRAYFDTNDGRLIHKWHHYFDIYHRHFAPFRGRDITVLEFGVSHGGSLEMWRNYFGPGARITGVDINPKTADLGGEQIEIVIGDQDDRKFLAELADRLGPIDVLIDDGGHTMTQQIGTFEILWPSIVEGGVYLVEDVHTSYWGPHGGGYKRDSTFIEYAKNLIDQLHAWHAPDSAVQKGLLVDEYTRSIGGMHVYNSVIVFDKARVPRPTHEERGQPSW